MFFIEESLAVEHLDGLLDGEAQAVLIDDMSYKYLKHISITADKIFPYAHWHLDHVNFFQVYIKMYVFLRTLEIFELKIPLSL